MRLSFLPTHDPVRRPLYLLTILCLGLCMSGCGKPFWLPPAHKIEVQQGNLLSQEQVSQIIVGMTRNEVLNVAGQPILDGSFHSDRWDYVYTRGPAGSAIIARSLLVEFNNESVVRVTDNHAEQTGEIVLRKSWWRRLFQRS